MTEPPWTIKEAAAAVGLSPSRLRQLALQGRTPGAFRPGGPAGHWRFDPEKLSILREPSQPPRRAVPDIRARRQEEAEYLLAYELLIKRKKPGKQKP